MRKNQDFLHNWEKIAIAHQCKMLSKFRAISTRNVRKSLRNCCTIFVQKISIGNLSSHHFSLLNSLYL